MFKRFNIKIKLIILTFLALMLAVPMLTKVKATSYTYDFWKNVIPSAEGLAFRETYYADSIKDKFGNNLVGDEIIKFDQLTDLAVDAKTSDLYILDSKKGVNRTLREEFTKSGIVYPKIETTNVSEIYVLDQNFRKAEEITEFIINDEVKEKLDSFYSYNLKAYQVSSENFSSNEMIDFGTKTEYKYTLNPLESSIDTEFSLAKKSGAKLTYNKNTITVSLDGKKLSEDMWEWEYVSDTTGKIKFDASVVSDKAKEVEVTHFSVKTSGKAPYLHNPHDGYNYLYLSNASGVTFVNDTLYVADSGNYRIIRAKKDVTLNKWVVNGVYLTPKNNTFYQISSGLTIQNSSITTFVPTKVAVDQRGVLFCIAANVYSGIMEFHVSGEFNRFLGKNTVTANPLKKFWAKIFSEVQISSLKLDLPPSFTNISTDANGFLYSTSKAGSETTPSKMVKMINSSGNDITRRNGYVTPDGDAVYVTTSTVAGVVVGASNLVGVTVSNNGNYTIVDSMRGRLFTYDEEGNLLYIAGDQPGGTSTAAQNGLSNSIIDPVAIRYYYRDTDELDENGNKVQEEVLLVLDANSKSILLYETTEFGKTVNKATDLYQKGKVQDETIYKIKVDEVGNPVLDAFGNYVYDLDENGQRIVDHVEYGSEHYWKQVVKMNTNYELAYLGIGKALHMRGEFKEAMSYFKLAHSANYYSKAWAEYRDAILSKNFSWIMTSFILLVVLWVVLSYRKSLKEKRARIAASIAMNEEKYQILSGKIHQLKNNKDSDTTEEKEEEKEDTKHQKFTLKKLLCLIKNFFQEVVVEPLHILTHPVQGFDEFKTEKKGKMWVAWAIILLYVVMEIIAYQYEGIIINKNNPQKFNSIAILVYGIVPPIIIAVGNWSVTTLLDGKGKMKEIFMMICYSMLPVTLIGFINIILSNVLTIDEAQFITILQIIGWILTGFMVFMGLVSIHEYGVGKTIFSIILTIVAVLIILFLALLIFDLAQQMYGFLYTLFKEIATRYL